MDVRATLKWLLGGIEIVMVVAGYRLDQGLVSSREKGFFFVEGGDHVLSTHCICPASYSMDTRRCPWGEAVGV
jgi:hypothetical protein